MRLYHVHASSLIKSARKIRNMSQLDLHLTMKPDGIKTPMQISAIERGKAPIPPKMVNKLCRHLGIHKEALLDAMVRDYQNALIDEVDKWN